MAFFSRNPKEYKADSSVQVQGTPIISDSASFGNYLQDHARAMARIEALRKEHEASRKVERQWVSPENSSTRAWEYRDVMWYEADQEPRIKHQGIIHGRVLTVPQENGPDVYLTSVRSAGVGLVPMMVMHDLERAKNYVATLTRLQAAAEPEQNTTSSGILPLGGVFGVSTISNSF